MLELEQGGTRHARRHTSRFKREAHRGDRPDQGSDRASQRGPERDQNPQYQDRRRGMGNGEHRPDLRQNPRRIFPATGDSQEPVSLDELASPGCADRTRPPAPITLRASNLVHFNAKPRSNTLVGARRVASQGDPFGVLYLLLSNCVIVINREGSSHD